MCGNPHFFDRLKAENACFGAAAGWERPNWFAPEGVEPKYEYSYGRQNWFDYSAAEHHAVRNNVGVFDQTSFLNFRMQGKDAVHVLNRVCGNQIDMPVGDVRYTQLLNHRGGIESDVTVARYAEDDFMVIDAYAFQTKTFHFLRQAIRNGEHAFLTDMSSAYAMLGVMGPNSRALLSQLTNADLSNEAFPFGSTQKIEFGYAYAQATRMTYVGELGWELLIPTDFALHAYDMLIEAGEEFDLKHCGMHAMNSLRIEKGYRHMGHDISDEDTPVEAGLSFAVKLDKEELNGRDILMQQKKEGVKKRLVMFALEDDQPMLYHNEPIWRDNENCWLSHFWHVWTHHWLLNRCWLCDPS